MGRISIPAAAGIGGKLKRQARIIPLKVHDTNPIAIAAKATYALYGVATILLAFNWIV